MSLLFVYNKARFFPDKAHIEAVHFFKGFAYKFVFLSNFFIISKQSVKSMLPKQRVRESHKGVLAIRRIFSLVDMITKPKF